jgi:hypothetical protein
MPSFLIALGVAAAYFLIPKKAKSTAVAVQATPNNSPVGISTGFPSAPVATAASSGPSSATSNQPSASSSGVPEYSPQTAEFSQAVSQMGPSGYGPVFYQDSQRLQPRQGNAQSMPGHHKKHESCGCGGGCASGSGSSSSTAPLAATKQDQVNGAPPGLIAQWAANLASVPVTPFAGYQQSVFDSENSIPANEGVTAPASPFLQPVGLTTSNLYGHH